MTRPSELSRAEIVDWMFRSRTTGKITLGQLPNLPQKIFTVTTVVGTLLPRSPLRRAAGVVAVLSLGLWATDEIARGVNPFRRLTGVVAIGGLIFLARRQRRR